MIKAKKEGVAKITVTIKGTEHKASCSINVQDTKKADEEILFTVETYVRLANDTDKTWKESVDAKIGDRVEFQINYKNTSTGYQNNVIIDDQLPANLRYVPGSTRIMNASFPQGATINEDDVTKTGIYIGNYGAGSNALIRFYADVVDDNFTCGRFTLRNWGRATVGQTVIQDSADIIVQLPDCQIRWLNQKN